MSNKYNALTIVLIDDINADDIEQLKNAIRQFKNVIDVTPIVSDIQCHVAELRSRHALAEKLLMTLYD